MDRDSVLAIIEEGDKAHQDYLKRDALWYKLYRQTRILTHIIVISSIIIWLAAEFFKMLLDLPFYVPLLTLVEYFLIVCLFHSRWYNQRVAEIEAISEET